MTKDEIQYFDTKFAELEKIYQTRYACEVKANACYVRNIEPLKRQAWLIGIVSGAVSSLIIMLVGFYLRGLM